MSLAVRTCPVCGDVRTVSARSKQPITRECRPCASRRCANLYPFTPESGARGRAAHLARLAQVDPVVVDLLVAGCPERATVPERVAAIRRMPGLSAAQQARKLGVTLRSVQRYRAILRGAA